ncbi:hypothetical protein ACHQM5_006386 [Ranunculus cassubicifolius]
MKFGKEFVSQMVPEWQETYMDYNHLKSLLKDIQLFKLKTKSSSHAPTGLKRSMTLYRAFSDLTERYDNFKRHHRGGGDVEGQVILTKDMENEGEDDIHGYRTTFLMSSGQGGEFEQGFFNKLDEEFNKEDAMLNKQMDALIVFRIKVENPDASIDWSLKSTETEMMRSSSSDADESTNKDELIFDRQNLRRVERILQLAFTEFYQKLRHLKSYSFLNILAFTKIMKKYDKITSRNASKSYLKMIHSSYLGSSDEVNKLMEMLEPTFIKHFANGNRSKGIIILRPKAKRERHRVTFSLGFFSGCTAALMVALILIISARHIIGKRGSTEYMETMFPHYSFFGYIVLHMFMFAGNIYYWRRYRINYAFIFGLKRGTHLGYREVLLFSSGLAALALATVLGNLDMDIDKETDDYKVLTELLPLILLIFVLLILFCPFNIVYPAGRFYVLLCLFHSICAPLYKVTLPDFFMADQLTSQVQAIRNFEFYICYYGWGNPKKREHRCHGHDVYETFNYIVATVPYWWRFLQCVRRLFEEKDAMQGYNALKYFSTIVALCLRTAYINSDATVWLVLAWIFSIISAIVSTYWDLVIDWGLLQRDSKNRWLRDKLLVPHKSIYFGAIVLNVLLRFAWLQTVMKFDVPFLHRQVQIAIVACSEIIRRGKWNFFRLENEHLNNVGKYRAFKSIPLPFSYSEEDDKEE